MAGCKVRSPPLQMDSPIFTCSRASSAAALFKRDAVHKVWLSGRFVSVQTLINMKQQAAVNWSIQQRLSLSPFGDHIEINIKGGGGGGASKLQLLNRDLRTSRNYMLYARYIHTFYWFKGLKQRSFTHFLQKHGCVTGNGAVLHCHLLRRATCWPQNTLISFKNSGYLWMILESTGREEVAALRDFYNS